MGEPNTSYTHTCCFTLIITGFSGVRLIYETKLVILNVIYTWSSVFPDVWEICFLPISTDWSSPRIALTISWGTSTNRRWGKSKINALRRARGEEMGWVVWKGRMRVLTVPGEEYIKIEITINRFSFLIRLPRRWTIKLYKKAKGGHDRNENVGWKSFVRDEEAEKETRTTGVAKETKKKRGRKDSYLLWGNWFSYFMIETNLNWSLVLLPVFRDEICMVADRGGTGPQAVAGPLNQVLKKLVLYPGRDVENPNSGRRKSEKA